MNNYDLKTFEAREFGALSTGNSFTSFAPAVEPTEKPIYTTMPVATIGGGKSGGLLDEDLIKSVQVVDTDTGYPLEKANVYAKSQPTRGGSTDANGNITIVAQSPDEVIVFQYQDKKVERVFSSLGSMINIDTKMTQSPVVVDGPATDKKVNWLKWAGIGVGAIVLINMLNQDQPKKVKV